MTTHLYDVLYEILELADDKNEVVYTRLAFLPLKDQLDKLITGGLIAVSNVTDGTVTYRIMPRGLQAFDMPHAFFGGLENAVHYIYDDEPSNLYFRDIHTGALVDAQRGKAGMFDSPRYEPLTEQEYIDAVNEAAAMATERDEVDIEAEDFHLEELPMPKESWLEHALAITTSDRRRDYGHPLPNFLRIALKWSVTMEHVVTPLQVAQMMLDMKTARDQNTYKDDNWIDAIGYSNCVQMMDDRMKEMGYPAGVRSFQDKNFDNIVGFMYNLLRKHEAQYPQGT